MTDDGTEVAMALVPGCQFCAVQMTVPPPARYDFKTSWGPWAYGCEKHFEQHSMYRELGTGKGQRIVHGSS